MVRLTVSMGIMNGLFKDGDMKWKPAEENSSYKFIGNNFFNLYNSTINI